MKRIIVYADFDFLTSPEEIGTLGYELVRGKDHFVFEYSRQCLNNRRQKILLRRFEPPSKTGAKPLPNCKYPSNC